MKTHHVSYSNTKFHDCFFRYFLPVAFFCTSFSVLSAQDVCRADTSFTDILFVIDNSQSIDDMEYTEFSNIIMGTISNVQQKCPLSQIGVIHYGGAFGKETFVQQEFSRIMQIVQIERQFCTERNQFNNCSEGGGDDLNAAMGDVLAKIADGSLNRNPINKLAIVIFTDAFGFEDTCTFINCSVIRPFTNIDILKSQFGAKVTVVGASTQAEASLLAIYASPGGSFNKVDLFANDCPTTFDGCTMPRKYIPIDFDSPVGPTSDSIAACVNCTIEIIAGVVADAGADQILCEEEDVTATLVAQLLNGTAPLTFTWDQGLGTGNNKQVAPAVTTTYSVTISDANGCQSSDAVTVFVENCIPDCGAPPIIICPADSILCPGADIRVSALGMATALPGDEYCPIPMVTVKDSIITTDNCNQLIYRIWTATYPGNNNFLSSSSCIQQILLQDNESPVIIGLPADITIDSDNNCVAAVIWQEPSAEDNCGLLNFSSNIPSGNNFDLGTTYVVYTASDFCGNVQVDSFAVSVIQQCCNAAPKLKCPPDYLGCPMSSSDPRMTGMAHASASTSLCDPPILTYSDKVTSYGTCEDQVIIERTWIARDRENPSLFSTCIQKISLIDTVPPKLLSCPPDVMLDPDHPVLEWEDPKVMENCNFRLSYSVPNGSTFPTGVTMVLVSAIDLCGNIDTCSFKVTVPEEVQIICPDELVLRCMDTLLPSMIPQPQLISTCPLCVGNMENCTQTTISIDTVITDGQRIIYTIRYTATDLCGTDNECTSEVIIDNSSFIACSNDIIVQAPAYGFTNVTWNKPSFHTCCSACKIRQIPGFLYMGQLGDSYYYCSYARVNWEKAQRVASENGGHLVAINSEQENNFIAQRLIERNAYIGLTDIDEEGNFKWVNNDITPFRKWKPGQPDNKNNEDYAEMDAQGYWYDVDGNTQREFVMEIKGCDPVIQIGGPQPGSKFRVGSTLITYYAEDGCGNQDQCSFNIIVLPPPISSNLIVEARSVSGKLTTINPNPGSGVLFVRTYHKKMVAIELYNMNGQMVDRINQISSNHHELDIAGRPPGLYVTRIILEDGQTEVQKVIIE